MTSRQNARPSVRWPLQHVRNCLAVLLPLVSAGCSASSNSPVATGTLPPASAVTQTPAPSAQQKPVRIAMLLPLGGFDQSAMIAKALKQAGEMALFELDNPMVQLVVKDDRGSSEGAEAAAREAVGEGAEIILGPLFAKAVPGAAAVARAANVPLVTFSNDRTAAGNGVYVMSFLAEPEVERIVAFAASQGKRRFAALIPENPYGQAIAPVFREAVARNGGSIAALETFPVIPNAMLSPVKKLAAALEAEEQAGQPADALFIPAGSESLPQIGPLLAYAAIDTTRITLLGTGAWDYPNLGREKIFAGGWYPSPDPRGFQDFSMRFARTFGMPPPRLASLAYDATAAAIALSSNPPGLRFTPANLTRPNGFAGVDGMVRFSASGLVERGLAVLEVQPFGARTIDPAPAALASPVMSAAPRPAAQ